MISIAAETLLPIRDVPSQLPKRSDGKKLHLSAVYRWIRAGIRGVVLETIRLGGCTYTSVEALQRFGERLSGSLEVKTIMKPSDGVRVAAATERLQRMLRRGK